MGCETEQYDKVCKGAFERIFGLLTAIDVALRGDPEGDQRPGVMTRLDRLERTAGARAKFFWMLAGSLIAVAVPLIGRKLFGA